MSQRDPKEPSTSGLMDVPSGFALNRPGFQKAPLGDVLRRFKDLTPASLESASPAHLGVGFMLGPYELLEPIGQGGMGRVFLACHRQTGQRAAIKVVEAHVFAAPDLIRRFKVEAQTAADLHHPNLVAFYAFGKAANHYWYAMDHIQGQTLSQWRTHAKPSWQRRLAVVEKVARAVHYAHLRGVVHRDLKPANIMIGENGEPKVIDFGLARLSPKHLKKAMTPQTISGQLLGTPHYMAPEQARGENSMVDARSDVFSLGVVLYELMTGAKPFSAPGVIALLKKITDEDPVPPSQINKRIKGDLETVILKCLHKDPSQRYASAAQLADDLLRVQRLEPIWGRTPGLGYVLAHHIQAHKALWFTASMGAFLLMGLLGLTVYRKVEHQKDLAAAHHKTQVVNQDLQEALTKQKKALLEAQWARAQSEEAQKAAQTALALERSAKAKAEQAKEDLLVAQMKMKRALQKESLALKEAQAAHALALVSEQKAQSALAVAQKARQAAIEAKVVSDAHLQRLQKQNQVFDLLVRAEKIAEEGGRVAAVLSVYQEALRIDPKDNRIVFHRARYHMDMGDYDTAITDFSAVLAGDVENMEALGYRSICYIRKGIIPYADLKAVAKARPDTLEGFYVRALLTKAPENLAVLDKGLAKFSSDLLYFERARVLADKKKYKEAVLDLDKAITLKPQALGAYMLKAQYLKKMGQSTKALGVYRDLLAKKPDFALGYLSRAGLYVTKKQYALALKDYAKAIEIRPDWEAPYRARGAAYTLVQEWTKALADFNKAIDINPYSKTAYVMRAKVHLKLGNTKQAEADRKKAKELGIKYR